MTIETSWSELAGFRLMQVRVAGPLDRDPVGQAADLIETAVQELTRAGLRDDRIVRSRIWARDANLRRVASDQRLVVLKDQRRGASSSFIVPSRLAPGIDVAVDVCALEGSRPKTVQEYEPRIAPPRYLKREGLVFLSGITDTQGAFADQLATVANLIGRSLEAAGSSWDRIIDVKSFVHHSVPWQSAHDQIRALFPCSVEMISVEGYSAAEKRLEIEITARN